MISCNLTLRLLLVLCVGLCHSTLLPSIYWDPRNPIFQKNLTMKVPAHSKMKIVCPNPASVLQETESSIPLEQMYSNLWIVTKQEFDICKINASDQSFSNEKRLLMSCNNPLQLKYYEMVFRAYTVPGSIAYEPGNSYYFIGTSDGTNHSLANHEGGHCLSSNMRMSIYVCNGSLDPNCHEDQQSSLSPTPSHSSQSSVFSVSTPTARITTSSALVTNSWSYMFPSVSAVSSASTALALQSSIAVQCQATINEMLIRSLINQSELLYDIYNYTLMIPDLSLMLQQKLNLSTGQTTETDGSSLKVITAKPAQRHCKNWLKKNYTESGSYRLLINWKTWQTNDRFRVYCDQETAGGGWTLWMRRFDGYIGFKRDWDSYEEGFGDTSGEFWLGLRSMEKIHADSKFSIRLDMETSDGSKDYAEYTNCELGDWQTMYTLTVGSFVGGGAGDSLSFQNGTKFSTFDKNNMQNTSTNCAQDTKGGWWFNDCQRKACLTGKYKNGIRWDSWKGSNETLSKIEMKVRPV